MSFDFQDKFALLAKSQEAQGVERAKADLPLIKSAVLKAVELGQNWIALVAFNAFPELSLGERWHLIQYPDAMTELESNAYFGKIIEELGGEFRLSWPDSPDRRALVSWGGRPRHPTQGWRL